MAGANFTKAGLNRADFSLQSHWQYRRGENN